MKFLTENIATVPDDLFHSKIFLQISQNRVQGYNWEFLTQYTMLYLLQIQRLVAFHG